MCAQVRQSCLTLRTLWTVVPQAPLFMGFSHGLPCPSSGDLPNPGIESMSPALQADCLPLNPMKGLKDIGSSSQMIKNFEDKVSGCTTQCMQQMQMSSTIQNGQVHVMWPSDLIQNFEILKWCWVILWFLKKTIFSYKYYLHDFNIINSQYSMKAMAKNDQFNGWSKCWTLFSLKIFLISQL